jgi:hypothetical protein
VSIARVTTVQHSRPRRDKTTGEVKKYVCEKDRTVIELGEPYRWFVVGFRSNYVHIRCMKPTCTPRMSELESSQLSEVYAAVESAEDELTGLENGDPGDTSDITSVFDQVGDAIDNVVSVYREADEQFGGGGQTDNSERADNLESAKDELDQISLDEFDESSCDEHDTFNEECDDCKELKATWWTEQIDAAKDVLSNLSF